MSGVDNVLAVLADKIDKNEWDNIQDFIKVLQLMREGNWSWTMNTQCKYVDLRVDMRDGGCIIMDREHRRILPEQLAYQYKTSDQA